MFNFFKKEAVPTLVCIEEKRPNPRIEKKGRSPYERAKIHMEPFLEGLGVKSVTDDVMHTLWLEGVAKVVGKSLRVEQAKPMMQDFLIALGVDEATDDLVRTLWSEGVAAAIRQSLELQQY